MTETIKNTITTYFQNNPWLATFIIALLPIFELRGAIPFGMSTQIWQGLALTPFVSFLTSFLGTTLIIPIIAIIFIPLINLLKQSKLFKNIATTFENKIKSKTNSITQKGTNKLNKLISVFLFVAIPLPLTGVYTGTCVAVMLGLNFYEILLTVASGNLIAGLIILLISTVFKNNTLTVIMAFALLTVLFIVFGFLIKVFKKHSNQKRKAD